jgi:hypothetical protein
MTSKGTGQMAKTDSLENDGAGVEVDDGDDGSDDDVLDDPSKYTTTVTASGIAAEGVGLLPGMAPEQPGISSGDNRTTGKQGATDRAVDRRVDSIEKTQQAVEQFLNSATPSTWGECSKQTMEIVRGRLENFSLLGKALGFGSILAWSSDPPTSGAGAHDSPHLIEALQGIPATARGFVRNDIDRLLAGVTCQAPQSEKNWWEGFRKLFSF